MSPTKDNRCARCGVPIKPDQDLCKICSRAAETRSTNVPCRACGAPNPSSAPVCSECGAPIMAREERPDGVGKLTGRRAEMQVLLDCFNVCMEKNHVGGAIVSGESGMGVTSLLEAFAERLTGRLPKKRIVFVQTREEGEAFSTMRGVLEQWFSIDKDEDPVTNRLLLTQKVGKVLGVGSAAQVTESTHLLGYLAGVPFPESPVLKSLEADQELMMRRIREAMLGFFAADIKREPAVFIFDDLHSAPKEARIFTMDLLNSLEPVPLTVVAGGRPGIEQITDNDSVVRIPLEPLDDDVMRRLFTVFMPKLVDPPTDLVEATVGRSQGNPGSLHELCALLTESGVVDTSNEPWTADVTKLEMADMPVNMIDALKARIEQLDPRDRRILEFAAIFGEVFWDEAIVGLARQESRIKPTIKAAHIWPDDSDGLTLSAALDRLVERQFVVPLPDADIKGCLKYAFAKSGVRAEILLGMKKEEVMVGHFLAAEWLTTASGSSEAPLAESVADHWIAANETRRASMAFFQAARHARSRYLNRKAIKLFKKGIELADPRDRLALADALHDMGSIHELLAEYNEAEECFTGMLKHAWILTHRGKGGAALNKIGRLYRARGDSAAAGAFLNRANALFKAAGDEKGVAACLGDLGELARRQGSYDRAYKLVNEALEIQRKLGNKPSIAVCLHNLGHIEAARASYAQAERYLEEALEIRRLAGDKGGMAQTLSTVAIILFGRGDLERAISRWEAALTLAEEVGDRRMLAIVNNNLGEAHRDSGRLDQSMKYFQACEEVCETLDDALLQAEVSRNMGILAEKMGDLESARKHLERSLGLSEEFGSKEMIGLAYRALGQLESMTMWDTSRVDGHDEAEIAYDKSLQIFRGIGNDFEVARTLHAMGNRRLERGDMTGATELLEEARKIFGHLDSKTEAKVSRTIREIAGQSQAPAARKKTARQPGAAATPDKKAKRPSKNKEPLPDMTGEIELEED